MSSVRLAVPRQTCLQAARYDFAYQFLLRVPECTPWTILSEPTHTRRGTNMVRSAPIRRKTDQSAYILAPCVCKGSDPFICAHRYALWCFGPYGRFFLHRQLFDCGLWHFQMPSGKTSGQSGFHWNPQVKLAAMLSGMVPLVTHFDGQGCPQPSSVGELDR